MTQPVYYGGTPTSSSGYQANGRPKPPPRGANDPGVDVRPPSSSTSAPASSKSSSTSTSTTESTPPRVVVYPNFDYQVSASDFYGERNPADPANSMWNIGLSKSDAEAMWDSGDFSPELKAYLDRVAYSQHPMKKGRTLWLEAVRTAYAMKGQGEDITAWSILSDKYLNPYSNPSLVTKTTDGSGPAGSGPSGGGYGGGGGGGQVSLTNPTSARGLLLQTMQSVLGRNPTDNEYKTFLQVLNEAEMANPQTVSVEGDTVVGSGGTDPGVLALEFAQDQEDYKERQGDMYFETFMRALAGGA